uniref:Nitric oxide reductase FlRd-NAD(+) reductase n=1 Tax=Candidatus Methanophagaceae archaeon ANME-1 ERB6 TaxID=2759912 RepID=A0A7G9Z0L3_9EURY|nr:nitric oxide reductase FlRd-NAD(+) reductase [Methanosarcinales archaeon ANME-1 ERB6]QNO53797.1 nitric oxide reductase FlRd-NAD(+) reductase [Methanosarcinales archaeon ANME-1 ERB6]
MKVIVLGCGFGGVEVANKLSKLRKRSKDLDIIMIDRRTRLEYQAAHPEILSEKVTPEEISGDLNKFASRINAEFINDAVVNIDFEAKKVKTHEGLEIPYDFLVVSIGAEQTFFGIPGAEERSYSVNTLKGAIETKNALDKRDYSKKISIAVIGAGLTGVEVAGELVDYFNFRDRASAKIYLVELMPRVLPAFPTENVANYVTKFISDSGVEILTDTAVQEVSEHEITFTDGTELHYDVIIWTAGIKPNSLLENLELGIPKEKGWLKVDPYLRVDGMKDVFAVGDTAYFENEGIRSGQNVEEAERQGKLAAENIIRTMKGKKLERYRAKNTIQNPRAFISLGNDKAVMYFGRMMFKVFAYRVKKFVERRYMKRFR